MTELAEIGSFILQMMKIFDEQQQTRFIIAVNLISAV